MTWCGALRRRRRLRHLVGHQRAVGACALVPDDRDPALPSEALGRGWQSVRHRPCGGARGGDRASVQRLASTQGLLGRRRELAGRGTGRPEHSSPGQLHRGTGLRHATAHEGPTAPDRLLRGRRQLLDRRPGGGPGRAATATKRAPRGSQDEATRGSLEHDRGHVIGALVDAGHRGLQSGERRGACPLCDRLEAGRRVPASRRQLVLEIANRASMRSPRSQLAPPGAPALAPAGARSRSDAGQRGVAPRRRRGRGAAPDPRRPALRGAGQRPPRGQFGVERPQAGARPGVAEVDADGVVAEVRADPGRCGSSPANVHSRASSPSGSTKKVS